VIKRIFDICFSLLVLILCLPVFVLVASAIKLSSPGPIFYRALRVGKNNANFQMYKFRTMNVSNHGPVITSLRDTRIFRVGSVLRKLKLDELPQFLNVLIGQMSIVGPRPEDPKIVSENYLPWMLETLAVAPGITSPGAVFYYAHGEAMIDPNAPEKSYVDKVLPLKLAVERAYLDRANFVSDLYYIWLTALAIVSHAFGVTLELPAQDTERAKNWTSVI
jgi:lipopolysaccharide/colanic/teichoic acid biosynthesis glycosyltransferase